jgi:small subunit ribosomal protein S1
VKILRVDPDERKIGLSRKRVNWAEEDEMAEASGESDGEGEKTSAPLKGGIGDESGPLIKTEESEANSPEQSAAEEGDES